MIADPEILIKDIILNSSSSRNSVSNSQYKIIEKLNNDAEKSSSTQTSTTFKDDVTRLSSEKQLIWGQLLSSAASAEGAEEMVINPVLAAFENNPVLHKYLHIHLTDEARHHKLLKAYALENFGFERKKKSLSGIFIYNGLFRIVALISKKRPLPILTAILFYEWFAEEFYSRLMKQAKEDGLHELKNLFAHIEKDELRHRAGIKAIMTIWKNEGWKIDKMDLFYTKALLSVTLFDVCTADWAVHNKKLISNLTRLGFDTKQLYDLSKTYAEKAVNELSNKVAS